MANAYGNIDITINKTNYLINEDVKGRMEFTSNIQEGQYPYKVFAQIICNQKITIQENNKTKYQIDNVNYVVKEVHVGTQTTIQGFYADFTLKTNEIHPSLYYTQGQIECLIQYFVNVVLRQSKTQKEIPISCSRKEIKFTTEYEEYREVQRDIITSYGFCGLWKRPIFFVLEAKRSHQNIELDLKIDQKYSHIKLNLIQVYFFQEFILNARIKRSFRRALNNKKILLEDDTFNENISFDIDKIPSQTLTQNFALQYYLSIVCQFNQCNGVPDQEIIVPIKIYNQDQKEPIQQIKQNFFSHQ
ncbi:hypothetical protein pb186bvf_010371 [Paramecium bursaria]